MRAAVAELGCPCVLKTADFGYDGKGQQKIDLRDGPGRGVEAARGLHGVLEGVGPFRRGAFGRGRARPGAGGGRGTPALAFPPTLNEHENHILATSVAPAPLADSILARAQSIAVAIAKELDVVGLLAVEFFLTKRGDLLVNELAPRPHNSGHYVSTPASRASSSSNCARCAACRWASRSGKRGRAEESAESDRGRGARLARPSSQSPISPRCISMAAGVPTRPQDGPRHPHLPRAAGRRVDRVAGRVLTVSSAALLGLARLARPCALQRPIAAG